MNKSYEFSTDVKMQKLPKESDMPEHIGEKMVDAIVNDKLCRALLVGGLVFAFCVASIAIFIFGQDSAYTALFGVLAAMLAGLLGYGKRSGLIRGKEDSETEESRGRGTV